MDISLRFLPAVRPSRAPLAAPRLHRLEPHAVQPIHLSRGACIAVSAGRLWLTESGDSADHFVGPGERHVVRRGGCVVLESDGAQAAEFELLRRPAATRR